MRGLGFRVVAMRKHDGSQAQQVAPDVLLLEQAHYLQWTQGVTNKQLKRLPEMHFHAQRSTGFQENSEREGA